MFSPNECVPHCPLAFALRRVVFSVAGTSDNRKQPEDHEPQTALWEFNLIALLRGTRDITML